MSYFVKLITRHFMTQHSLVEPVVVVCYPITHKIINRGMSFVIARVQLIMN